MKTAMMKPVKLKKLIMPKMKIRKFLVGVKLNMVGFARQEHTEWVTRG